MADGSSSGKTNREIVTEYYTRYAEEIAGYENTLANLRIQLTQAQQDGDADRAAGSAGQIDDYTNRESVAKGQCSIPELGLQGFDAVNASATTRSSSWPRRWTRPSSPTRRLPQARPAAWTTPRRSLSSPSARTTP